MPVITDLATALKKATSSDKRTLILVDEEKLKQVSCTFDYPFDSSESMEAISQMFDPTFEVMESLLDDFVTSARLPIIHYLGRFKVTVIEKHDHLHFLVSDGENKPMDNYISAGE